jgi:hypothetical protein
MKGGKCMSQDFKYLGNNPGISQFPSLGNLNVEKSVTNFNYSLRDKDTSLYLKHVPASWGSDYTNVVQFSDVETRDTYFKTNPPIKLDTEFRIDHNGVVRLLIPYDNLINYNYLAVYYPEAPVPNYDKNSARMSYFYFIEDCKYISPNTTEVILTLDVWTTYINDVNIFNMTLERGHYPMSLTDVDSYLANPLNNRMGIGTVDVNFGELCKVGQYHDYDLLSGSTQYVVIATTANPTSFTDQVTTYNGGVTMERGIYYFAVKLSDWSTFVNNTMTNTPAFFQTIVGVMILNNNFVTVGSESFTFNSTTCYTSIGGKLDAINYSFTKADFGYDSRYDWLTKLYTFPYAAVEYVDQNGNAQLIKYEDLYVGKFALSIFTKLCVGNHMSKAVILNICGNGLQGEFNMHNFDIPIPATVINQSPNNAYMFETKYPRIQQQNDINTSYANSNRSNATGKTNADASANTSSSISKRGNDQAKDFVTHDLDTSATVLAANIDQNKRMSYGNMLTQQYSAWNNLNNENTSFTAKGAGTIAAMTNTVAMGAMGGVAGNPMAVPSIAAGVVNQSYNFSTADTMFDIVSQMIEVNLNQSLQIQRAISGLHEDHTFTAQSVDKTINVALTAENGLLNNTANANFATNRTNTEYKRDESYSVAETNRVATLNQSLANNQRSYDTTAANNDSTKSNSETSIQNAINQSFYNNNRTFGAPGDVSGYDGYRNIIQYHIKTQSVDAIKRAADYFLKYGYTYDGNVDFNSFLIMDHFTYWKCKDLWLDSDKVNNNIVNTIKNILISGVTVWSNPTEVGKINIYNNKPVI